MSRQLPMDALYNECYVVCTSHSAMPFLLDGAPFDHAGFILHVEMHKKTVLFLG